MPPLCGRPPSKRRIFERSSCGRWEKKNQKRKCEEKKKKIQDKHADLPPLKMEKFHHCECRRKRNVLFFPICVRQGLKSRTNRRVTPRKLGAGVYLKTGECVCVCMGCPRRVVSAFDECVFLYINGCGIFYCCRCVHAK